MPPAAGEIIWIIPNRGHADDSSRDGYPSLIPMKTKHILAAACAASLGFTSAFAAGEGWTHDYAAAKKQAAEEKKDLLLDFTGSDWCPPCKMLTANILSKPEFRELTKDKYVLVELDFPQDETKVSEETRKQNEELQGKYAIEGYPTILLCDADGRPYAKTGFQQGGPEEYVKHLDELQAAKATRDKAFADADKAEGPAKAKALVSALEAMDLADGAVAEFYPKVIDQIKAADPKDETGFAAKIAMKKKFAAYEKELNGFATKQDHDGALAFVEKSSGEFEGELKQQIVATKAMILARQEKFDEAIKVLDEAKAIAPDSEMAAQFDGFKEQLEAAKNRPQDEEEEE